MGNAEFFEFVLKNPYNTDITINIEVSDPELRLEFCFWIAKLLNISIFHFIYVYTISFYMYSI